MAKNRVPTLHSKEIWGQLWGQLLTPRSELPPTQSPLTSFAGLALAMVSVHRLASLMHDGHHSHHEKTFFLPRARQET